jgi:hypothetical protein
MRLSLLASVEVKVFHATVAHSSLDLTKVKYRVITNDVSDYIHLLERK